MYLARRLAASVALLFAFMVSGCAIHPSQDGAFGVIVMAHGGSKQWNERVLAAVEPLRARNKLEVAFGMADAASLQRSVSELEDQGVRRIAVVRLFVSGESWYERTQQILGIAPGAPPRPDQEHAHTDEAHAGHSMQFWRISSHSAFVLSEEGLADAPEMDAIFASAH
jgi:sirohydrochlorin cobaltochelatase